MNSLKKYSKSITESFKKKHNNEPFSWKMFAKNFLFSSGIMVANGYVDVGNFSVNLGAGSSFGYSLLFIILFSNIMANIFQSLCVKLGVVSNLDLAENCNKHFNKYFNFFLYILSELAIISTDLAEVIGSALSLYLLFGLPITWGIVLTGCDALLILAFFKAKFMKIFERLMFIVVVSIGICFAILVFQTTSDWKAVFSGYIPNDIVFQNRKALYLSLGILGATLMPHNLFLHSNLVKYRSSRQGNLGDIVEVDVDTEPEKGDVYKNRHIKSILKYFYLDSFLSLSMALLINSAILICAASTFTSRGITTDSLTEAYSLFNDIIGKWSAVLFAVALLLSGQSSTVASTLTGQIVMTGFLGKKYKIKPWLRRLITRSCAIVPAVIVSVTSGESGISKLLVLSQVILSLALPFAIIPLIYFTSSAKIMTIECVKYNKETSSSMSVDDNTLNSETEETVNFANGMFTKIVTTLLGALLVGLNVYLLTSIKDSFSEE